MSSMEVRRRKSSQGLKGEGNEEGAERVRQLIIQCGERAPAAVKPFVVHVATAVAIGLRVWDVASPYLLQAFEMGKKVYAQTPDDILQAILGLLMCFFGGTFSATIAAVEAFRLTGWDQTKRSLLSLYEDYQVVKKAHDEDEKKDLDGDGKADVTQISPSELLARKAHLVLVSIKDPEKVNSALVGIASSMLSVVAVLRVEFAKTITLAMSISNAMRSMAEKFALPILEKIVPGEYAHWLPMVISYVCKSVAMAIAWYISKIISAFHSGIKGGVMFARHMLNWCNKKKYLSLKHEDTYADEVVGWALAALGVYFQIRYGFALPFPFNILLFPLSFMEWLIIWVVSDTDIVVPA